MLDTKKEEFLGAGHEESFFTDVFSDGDDNTTPSPSKEATSSEKLRKQYDKALSRMRDQHSRDMTAMKAMLIEQLTRERENFKRTMLESDSRAEKMINKMREQYEAMLTLQHTQHTQVQEEQQLGMLEIASSKISVEEHKRSLLELNMVYAAAQESLKNKLEIEKQSELKVSRVQYEKNLQGYERQLMEKEQTIREAHMVSELKFKSLNESVTSKDREIKKQKEKLTAERQARILNESKLKEACKHIISLKSQNADTAAELEKVRKKLVSTKERKSICKDKLTECSIALASMKEKSIGKINLLKQENEHYEKIAERDRQLATQMEEKVENLESMVKKLERHDIIQKKEFEASLDKLHSSKIVLENEVSKKQEELENFTTLAAVVEEAKKGLEIKLLEAQKTIEEMAERALVDGKTANEWKDLYLKHQEEVVPVPDTEEQEPPQSSPPQK